MKSRTTYTMRARAESVQRTRTTILQAVLDLATELPFTAVTLAVVAARAGVSVQTVLRQFRSRDGLIDEAVAYATTQETEGRRATGDVDAALRALLRQYEASADRMLMLLAQEHFEPRVRTITEHGRAIHREWVSDVFAEALTDVPSGAREETLDLLIVATDLFTWKLLRRDRGLSKPQVLRRMRHLIDAALAQTAHRKEDDG